MADGITPPGLTSTEAARRLEADGPNSLVPKRTGSRWRNAFEPLLDPMVLLLLVAAPTYFAIGDISDGVITCIALAPIAGVSWALEHRAERTLEQLRRLTAPSAHVWRDGELTTVPTEAIVVGDAVEIREGDVVPADLRLDDVSQLDVDESSLTGESIPVPKSSGAEVYGGTTVVSGRACGCVTATGLRTRYGQIGGLVATAVAPTTPLQRAVRRMVVVFGTVAAAFCATVVVVELLRGHGWASALIAGVSLAIAAVPEEFPMVYTLYLALGAWRLSREQALVRRLPGVETLGSTTVICTDKTGTLTHGHLEVVGVTPIRAESDAELLEAAVLACEPHPFDPLDIAIVNYARSHGIDVDRLASARLVVDHPFDPVDKYLTHVWEFPDGTQRVAAKGSIEGILRHSSLDPALVPVAHADHTAFAQVGMRVIAVAAGSVTGRGPGVRDEHEDRLVYLGLLAFSDTVREGVREALDDCRSAGIRVVMITGDHPVTAHAIAEGLELAHTDGAGSDIIATGEELDSADEASLNRIVATTNVFARIRPEQKHRIVRALRAQGEVVAMTGDGVNDAPALREADIGVAMGRRGTAVARSAATMVLLDDNFSTIVSAIRDGRRIFDNLRRAFAYLVAFHVPLLMAALVVPFAGKPLLLLPVHLVLLEIVLHPAVSLVFEADPAAPGTMQRPPLSPTEGLLTRRLWRPFALGLTLSTTMLATYFVCLARGWEVDKARTVSFALLLAGQMLLLLVERSPELPLWRGFRSTRTLWWVLVTFGATLVIVTYIGPLARVLRLGAPDGGTWLVIIGLACAATLWGEPLKGRARNRRPRSDIPTSRARPGDTPPQD